MTLTDAKNKYDKTRRKKMTLKILNLYAGIGGNRKLWGGGYYGHCC